MDDADRALLDFEHHWWSIGTPAGGLWGAKERAIFPAFGCSVTSYYMRLRRLLYRAEAHAAYPAMMRALCDRVARRHRLR